MSTDKRECCGRTGHVAIGSWCHCGAKRGLDGKYYQQRADGSYYRPEDETVRPPPLTDDQIRSEVDMAEGYYSRWLLAQIRRKQLEVRVASLIRRYLVSLNYWGLRTADKRTWNELRACADELARDRLEPTTPTPCECCGGPGGPPHICVYDEDVHNGVGEMCHHCEACEKEHADDI